jgi:carbamoyl-phosphate synthase large subunit
MKSVGEAMGIGRTFTEAYLKAHRSRELDAGATTPWRAFDDLPEGVHPWFQAEIDRIKDALANETDVLALKRLGLPDSMIGREHDLRPAYRRVDSCAAEVEARSNYLYSTWGEADEEPPEPGRSVVILGSGPNRIGQGIEFDYCCVHAAMSFRALGYEAVMVNCNPETVSTDYDTSDRLYFEPLGVEEVLNVLEREQPVGVVIQFGGQTPLKLASAIEEAGFRVLGTPFDAIDLAEDRERFGALIDSLGIRCPEWGIAESATEAYAVAHRIGYPVLVRPSYVLGGRAMRVCYTPKQVVDAFHANVHGRTLVDSFLENAIEIDVDALSDGQDTYIGAVMQHVEEAGVHSGDSACVLPAPSLTAAQEREIADTVRTLARGLGVVGLLNVQLAVADGEVFVLEANPRASRTVPFASKATGLNLVQAACRLTLGEKLRDLELPPERRPAQVSVKAAVLPFHRFPGSDPVLGPEMRATGEVMASAAGPADGVRKGGACRRAPAADERHGLPLRARPRQACARARRRRARRPRLRPRRHGGNRRDARGCGSRSRARAQGGRGRRRRDRRRPRPPRPLRPRHQHPAGIGRADGRLSDPRGRARQPRPVHHDDLRRRCSRARDRERANRCRALAAGAHRS